MEIGTTVSKLSYWKRSEGSRPDDVGIEGAWQLEWQSGRPQALAAGSNDIVGDYWICANPIHENDWGTQDNFTTVTYGTGSTEVMKVELDGEMRPNYFALACQYDTTFDDITIIPYAEFQEFISSKISVPPTCPVIPNCVDTAPQKFPDCFCENGCKPDFKFKDKTKTECVPKGCDNVTIPHCKDYEVKTLDITEVDGENMDACVCKKCAADIFQIVTLPEAPWSKCMCDIVQYVLQVDSNCEELTDSAPDQDKCICTKCADGYGRSQSTGKCEQLTWSQEKCKPATNNQVIFKAS